MHELSQFAGYSIQRNESALHSHDPSERAGEFTAFEAGAPELECLEFLFGMVRLFKPKLVLETGTGSGFSTIALAAALQENGSGHLHTVELDSRNVDRARCAIQVFDYKLLERVTFHTVNSLDLIGGWTGAPFDFVFHDSLIELRHIEFEKLLQRRLLSEKAICVFHDTSRLRGETMHDYSQEMIDALDRASQGRQWLECDLSRGLRLIKLG